MLINNSRSIPQNPPPFGRKMVEKPRIYGGTSPKKLRFTENDGYGWNVIRTLSSKMMEMAGNLIGDGRKMATTAMATQDHAPPLSCIAYRPKPKLQA